MDSDLGSGHYTDPNLKEICKDANVKYRTFLADIPKNIHQGLMQYFIHIDPKTNTKHRILRFNTTRGTKLEAMVRTFERTYKTTSTISTTKAAEFFVEAIRAESIRTNLIQQAHRIGGVSKAKTVITNNQLGVRCGLRYSHRTLRAKSNFKSYSTASYHIGKMNRLGLIQTRTELGMTEWSFNYETLGFKRTALRIEKEQKNGELLKAAPIKRPKEKRKKSNRIRTSNAYGMYK